MTRLLIMYVLSVEISLLLLWLLSAMLKMDVCGREYGVLHPKALNKNYRTQAGWCAATVQKNYDRWVKAGSKGTYIGFLGSRYCPLDDPRDTDGLNKHWIGNVTKFSKRFGLK
jgi:hypothetical protein